MLVGPIYSDLQPLVTSLQPVPAAAQEERVLARHEKEERNRQFNFTIASLVAGAGFGEDGMPVGLQLIGNYFDEGRLLHAAHALQQATDWHLRVPKEAPL